MLRCTARPTPDQLAEARRRALAGDTLAFRALAELLLGDDPPYAHNGREAQLRDDTAELAEAAGVRWDDYPDGLRADGWGRYVIDAEARVDGPPALVV